MDQIDLEGMAPLALPDPLGSASADVFDPEDQEAPEGLGAPEPARDVVAPVPQAQIDRIPPPLDIEVRRARKFDQRSDGLLAFARQSKANKRLESQNAALTRSLEQPQQTLHAVTSLLPAAAKLLGRERVEQIGRKKALTPAHFVLLSRATHLPASVTLALGVKHKRVILAATRILPNRQSRGLRHLLDTSADALCMHGGTGQRRTHVSYVHQWDETKVLQKGGPTKALKDSRMGVHAQTIVQRGLVQCVLLDDASGHLGVFDEAWLAQPLQVESTGALSLYPAILHALPAHYNFEDIEKVAEMARSVSSCTFLPLCDKASGNLQILKHWATAVKTTIRQKVGPNVLYWPDTCVVHLEARGKLVLADMRRHTVRHFSIANLHRLHEVRVRMLHNLELLVSKKFRRRVVGEPPEGALGLATFIDAVFDMSAPHHCRGEDGLGKSRRWHDLQTLGELINCDVPSGTLGSTIAEAEAPQRHVMRKQGTHCHWKS